jgi:hypothetical protein
MHCTDAVALHVVVTAALGNASIGYRVVFACLSPALGFTPTTKIVHYAGLRSACVLAALVLPA